MFMVAAMPVRLIDTDMLALLVAGLLNNGRSSGAVRVDPADERGGTP